MKDKNKNKDKDKDKDKNTTNETVASVINIRKNHHNLRTSSFLQDGEKDLEQAIKDALVPKPSLAAFIYMITQMIFYLTIVGMIVAGCVGAFTHNSSSDCLEACHIGQVKKCGWIIECEK